MVSKEKNGFKGTIGRTDKERNGGLKGVGQGKVRVGGHPKVNNGGECVDSTESI